jgi:LysM repeat protein
MPPSRRALPMDTSQSSNARLAAIIALAVAFIVLVVIIVSSLGGGDGSGDHATRTVGRSKSVKPAANGSDRKIYVVKPGDTLIRIAHKVGIPVDRLQTLNPNIDQFSLQSGDRVKLR